MERELPVLKRSDWSLNLEEVEEANPGEMLPAAAAEKTAPGCYVNWATPGAAGHPTRENR